MRMVEEERGRRHEGCVYFCSVETGERDAGSGWRAKPQAGIGSLGKTRSPLKHPIKDRAGSGRMVLWLFFLVLSPD